MAQRGQRESDGAKVALVADDDRDTRAMLARLLVARGWRVQACGDGLSAIQYLDEYRVHAAIVDIHMSGPSGTRLLEYTRELYPDAKLVLISGWVESWAQRHAEKIGATVLTKPFTMAEILESVGEPNG